MNRSLGALGLLAAVVLAGCYPEPPSESGPTWSPTARIGSPEVFRPDALPYEAAELNYSSAIVPATMVRDANGSRIVLRLESEGGVLDEETYQASADTFAFVSNHLVQFDPPLILLRFPMDIGDSWEWKGNVREGDQDYPAHAQVRTGEEPANLPPPFTETVRVTADLELRRGPSERTRREVSFWFVEGRGVVKRSLGPLDTRQPARDRS